MIREDLPNLLDAYCGLASHGADWVSSSHRFLTILGRLHDETPAAVDDEAAALRYGALLVALQRQLIGNSDGAVAALREARPAMIGDADLASPVDAAFTADSIERLEAQHRAAVLGSFFASCGAHQDALELFASLAQAGRRRTLWESMLLARCLAAVDDVSTALSIAQATLGELVSRRQQLDTGALRLNFGGRVGPMLQRIAAAALLRDGTGQDSQRKAIYLLDHGRDPLLAEIVNTASAAPIPIQLRMDVIRECWASEAEAFQWSEIESRCLIENGSGPESRRAIERRIAAEERMAAAKTNLAQQAPSLYSMFLAPGRSLLRSPAAPTVVEDAQKVLADGTGILGFDILDDVVIGWTITRDRLVVIRLPLSPGALAEQVTSVAASCAYGMLAVDPALDSLSDALLASANEVLESTTDLLIVPSGPLRTLPFAVLRWRNQPLIATHSCSILPTLGLMQARSPGAPPTDPPVIAAFGNPSNMRWTPPSGAVKAGDALQFAEREAQQVAALANVKALCGPAATREAVISALGTSDILHLATHAVFSAEAPLLSAFLLAEGEQLSVIDLLAIESRCPLIVASACGTGEGRQTSGDDVLGISRGLLGCGASAALVSLWPVDDEGTANLMVAFYRGVLGGLTPARALQQAQRSFLTASGAEAQAGHSSPGGGGIPLATEQFWSPFVLISR